MMLLTLGGVILAGIQVWAALKTSAAVEQHSQTMFHISAFQRDVSWHTQLTAERLGLLINETIWIPRLLLMQLCKDHPVWLVIII